MLSTLDIEDDLLAAAKELARREGTSAVQMVSRLLRAALLATTTPTASPGLPAAPEAGFHLFPAQAGQLANTELIDRLRDEAGL